MLPVWAEACTHCCVVVVKFKTVVLTDFYASVSLWSQLDSAKIQTDWKANTLMIKGKHLTCRQHVVTEIIQQFLQQWSVLPSTTMAAIKITNQHSHTLNQQVDGNTHGKNSVTAKRWFRWFQWWQMSDDLRNKINKTKWCLRYVTCANTLLFLSSLKLNYIYLQYRSKDRHSAVWVVTHQPWFGKASHH